MVSTAREGDFAIVVSYCTEYSLNVDVQLHLGRLYRELSTKQCYTVLSHTQLYKPHVHPDHN